MYYKSDNAGWYHGNPYTESIYKTTKFHYIEPQKDKDQCGRGSTLARNALRRYIDDGNVTKAEDIFKALLASTMNNAKGTRSRI